MNKIFKTFSAIAMALMAMAGVTSCEKSGKDDGGQTAAEKEMQSVVEQYVPGVIYSIYRDLADESNDLYELLAAASDKGVSALSQAEIDAICAKFLQARQSWEESEAFLIGAATDFAIDPHIDTWPLDLDALAVALKNKDQIEALRGEDGIAYAAGKLGAELLGFHGIEFILFRDGKNRTVASLNAVENNPVFEANGAVSVTGEQELIYAAAVAGDLRDNCYRLYASWDADCAAKYADRCGELEVSTTIGSKSYGENMLSATRAGSTYATWQEVCADILVGGCSGIANEVANVKMGNAHSGEDENYIESPYSEKSFQDFIDNILSVQYSLYGKSMATSADRNSLVSFMKNNGYNGVSALESALSSSLAALRACQAKGSFVQIYKDDLVQKAMDAVNDLDTELNKAASWIVLQ